MTHSIERHRSVYFLAAAAALATLAVFLPSLRHGFVNWDDYAYIVDNPHIRRLNGAFLKWALTDTATDYWLPLTWLSHALDHAVWGLNPLGHHLTSVVIHALNTFVVVVLAAMLLEAGQAAGERRRRGPADAGGLSISAAPGTTRATALITGLLFGLHPLRVESVAWVSERKDLLCALFFLLSIMAYLLRFRKGEEGAGRGREAGWWSSRWHHLSLVLFVLALFSKPMAVTLPAVLLLLDWHPLGRLVSRKSIVPLIIEKLPPIALSLGVSFAAFAAQQANKAVISLDQVSLADRIGTSAHALVSYLGKIAAPVHLLPVYPSTRGGVLQAPEQLWAAVIVCGITALCVIRLRKERLLPAVWAYYCITLLPVLGLIRVGAVSVADRFTYLPAAGPFLLAGLGAAWVWEEAYRRWGGAGRTGTAVAGIALLVLLSAGTVKQIGIWNNSIALWNAVIEREPGVPLAYNNRGMAWEEAGRIDLALADFNRAIALDPAYPDVYRSRGLLYQRTGRLDRAIEDLSAVAALRPNDASAFVDRGQAYEASGRTDLAVADYTIAIALDPASADAYMHRGMALKAEGRFERAIQEYTAAISRDPLSAAAFNNRGVAFKHLNRLDRALSDFDAAIAIDPSFALAFVNRGVVLGMLGRDSGAFADYTKALSLQPDFAAAYLFRGRLHHKAGRRLLAEKDFQKACELGNEEGCRAAGSGRKP
jgi:tetratricopeptide (TPR) repeat protein